MLKDRLINHLELIYPDLNHEKLAQQVIDTFWPGEEQRPAEESHIPHSGIWSEEHTTIITYGDSILKKDEKPLETLHHFLNTDLEGLIDFVHILPFFPYSSDDGFAVKDYYEVRHDLGNWDEIKAIGSDFKLMSDLVLNHASAKSGWFESFLNDEEPYNDYFCIASPNDDLSAVVRPRPYPLLTAFDTDKGTKHLWCTFGPDQVDINFKNPKVLLEFVNIIRYYLEQNVRIFRLDAVGFLWKEIGTTSIHLPQTHEIIRLFRTLLDFYKSDALIITETNVPHHENLSYFGNQNEAHLIYNFSLPPLLIQALLTGNEYYLHKWTMELPPTQDGCAYFNFIASHDGIGLRPATGILLEEDFDEMIETIKSFGGKISMRKTEDGGEQPYEMNIALFDALKGTIEGEDEWQIDRFIAAHCVLLAFQGVPAFYIHSLLATQNDYEKFEKTQHNRSLNRHQWDADILKEKLADETSDQALVLKRLKELIRIRTQQKSFHPNATQFTLHLPHGFFGILRQSLDRKQDTFCITNLTNKPLELHLHNLHLYSGYAWTDLIRGDVFEHRDQDIIFQPYQSMWITNKKA